MKKLLLILLLFPVITSFSQDKYMTRTGHIWFFSTTPIENIEAHNRQANAVFSSTGEFAATLLMQAFQFEKALMQEHFNENYVESSKYPKSTYKGKVQNFDKNNLKENQELKVIIDGELTIHGVTKKITSEGTLKKQGENLLVRSKIQVNPKDYNIKIPKMVEGNIAKTIDVNIDLSLQKVK